MSIEINLLRSQQSKRKDIFKKSLRILRIVSVISLISVSLTTTVLFIIQSQSQLEYLENEALSISTKLDSLQDKIGAYYLIKDRVGNISTVLSQRTAFDTFIVYVLQNIPRNVSIDAFSLDKTGVRLSISSTSLLDISQCIDNLVSLTKTHREFKRLSMGSFGYDTVKSMYVVTFSIDIG